MHAARRRKAAPDVEALEGRRLLSNLPADASEGIRQLEAIRVSTLQALGDASRQIDAAASQFADRAASAVGSLTQALADARRQAQSGPPSASRQAQGRIRAISKGLARDRQLAGLGASAATRVANAIAVARGVKDVDTDTGIADIQNDVGNGVSAIVADATKTSNIYVRNARNQAASVVRQLDNYGRQLVVNVPGG